MTEGTEGNDLLWIVCILFVQFMSLIPFMWMACKRDCLLDSMRQVYRCAEDNPHLQRMIFQIFVEQGCSTAPLTGKEGDRK